MFFVTLHQMLILPSPLITTLNPLDNILWLQYSMNLYPPGSPLCLLRRWEQVPLHSWTHNMGIH
jgi:hypothetical protein